MPARIATRHRCPRFRTEASRTAGWSQSCGISAALDGGRRGDLAALGLARDQRADARLDLVLVLRRIEGLVAQAIDELARERELGGGRLDVLAERDLAPRLDLVGVAQLVHRKPGLVRAQLDDVLLAARRIRRDRDELGVVERIAKQLIGAIAALARPEIVAA